MTTHLLPTRLAALIAIATTTACGAGAPGPEAIGARADAIVGGTRADAYEEAALVNVYEAGQLVALCTGAVVARRAVITAGHCVDGFASWRVFAPYAGDGQGAYAWTGVTYDYAGHAQEYLTPEVHDVGLLLLDESIDLAAYPSIAIAPLPDGSQVVQVGRIDDGLPSMKDLFVSDALTVQDGAVAAFPFDYLTFPGVGQEGDSGGPSLVPGPIPRSLVAVTSGQSLVARVDLVRDWLDQQIAAHEAAGAGGAGGAGAGGGSGGQAATTMKPIAARDAGSSAEAGPEADAIAEADAAPDVAVQCSARRAPVRSPGASASIALAAAVLASRRRARRFRSSP